MAKGVPQFVVIAVRSLLWATSRRRAIRQAEKWRDAYVALGSGLSEEEGRRSVRVPSMQGVDPEMRKWSYYQLLEHNAIVNRAMSEVVRSLATGTEPGEAAQINPKKDVLPGEDSGPEQVDVFCASVDDHISSLQTLPRLRGTEKKDHPVFGSFDAHRWNSMFSFHLKIHWKQAKAIVSALQS